MNIIYYQTKTKFVNTGDALINKALLDALRGFGKLKCNCSKDIPDYFIKELGIEDSEKISADNELGFVLEILKDARNAKKNNSKVFIVSGLGHNSGGSLKKCARNIVASLIFIVYRAFGVKTIRIGTSIGPISKLLAITENFRSKFIDYYYVRDTKSLKLCHSIGIKNAKLCPDMSWLYDLNGKRELIQNNNICVNLKSTIVSSSDADDKTYQQSMINKCEEIVKKIYSEDSTIYFCYQVLEDKGYCEYVYSYFKDKYRCILIDKQMRLGDAEEVYGKCGYNISNRMHSLLLGYKYGSLPIALIDQKKHTKIQQTMIDSGLGELSIDVYNGSTKEIENIVGNREKLADIVFKAEKDRQKDIFSVLDMIFGKTTILGEK